MNTEAIGGPHTYGAAMLDHNPGDLNPAINVNIGRNRLIPYRPPLQLEGYQPFTKSKTTYNGMNDWMAMQGRVGGNSIPVTMSDGNWRQVKASSIPPPFRPSTQEDYYQKYKELVQKKAYRYPNPGKPILREGNIGGSWRHVKEVLGNKGYRVVYIDGVVRQYDHSKLNSDLADRRIGGKGTPLYALNRHDMSSHRRGQNLENEKQQFKPWLPPQLIQQQHADLPPIYDAPQPPQLTGSREYSSDRYRGFYQRN